MRLPNFNAAQNAAIQHVDGPCILLAGPGAGKTAVLTARAAKLVASGIEPSRILLLTFSRNASREMLSRAQAIEPMCEAISGGTFHSVAMKVINRNAHIFGMDKPFTVLDPSEAKEIVKRLMSPLTKGEENWPTPAKVSNVISFAANTLLPIEECVKRLAPSYFDRLTDFEDVRDRYVSYKLERGMIDFDDILIYFATLLEDEDIGPEIRSQWSHLMVDEYQDSNAVQLRIVYGLAGEARNVMIVGDPSQSIYGFRGSAPATMRGFHNKFPESKIIALDQNYRSSSEIVEMVNAVDRIIDSGFQRNLVSSAGTTGIKPVLLECTDDIAQAAEIRKAILAHKANGGELADIAILVRSMGFARTIELELTSKRIPYRVVGGIRIDKTAHVADLLSIARVALNAAHEPAWLRILARHKKIADVSAGQIADRLMAAADPAAIPQILADEAQKRKTSFEGLPAALRLLMNPDVRPVDAISQTIDLMEPFWKELKDWKDDWNDRRRDLDAITTIAGDHLTLDAFLTAVTIDYRVDQKMSGTAEKEEEIPLTISTMHGAKGLEWPIVHIPSFIRGHLPSAYADDPGEEARVLYVGLSRAKRELTLYKPNFNNKDGFNQASEFERIIRPYALVERAIQPAHAGGPVQTTKRIDMRAKMLRPAA